MLHPRATHAVVVVAGLLAWPSLARAAPGEEPHSVGERFSAINRPDGIVVEGWEVRPGALLRAGYDDNITLARGAGPSSSSLELRGSIDANRGIGPYALDLRASLGQTWYPEARANDVLEGDVGAAVVLDLKPMLLRGAVSFAQDVDKGTDNGIFVDGVFEPYEKRAVFRRLPFEVRADYDVGLFDLLGEARLTAVDYDPQTTVSGLSVSQDFRSGWEGDLRLRNGYEVYPGLSLFGEARARVRRYQDAQGDGDDWRLVAGGEIELSRLLVGEASAGYTQLSLPNGGETAGATYGAKLHWFTSELLSLTFNAERSFDGEVVTTGLGVTSAEPVIRDSFGIRAEWEPLRRLLLHADAGYERETHDSSGRTDEFTSLIAGATYVLTSSLRLTVDGSYEFGASNFSGDIERHSVSVGLAAAY